MHRLTICVAVLFLASAAGHAARADDDQVVSLVIDLLKDKDPEVRALGLQQVRESARGEAATRQFAAVLPSLSPAAQAGLIDALAARGDKLARPAVLDRLAKGEEPVQAAALRALASLGDAGDAAALLDAFARQTGQRHDAARASLVALPGAAVTRAIAEGLKPLDSAKTQIELLDVLVERQDRLGVPGILDLADHADAKVRAAAQNAIGKLAQADDFPRVVAVLLKAQNPAERDAWEKAIVLVCDRAKEPARRAEPLVREYRRLGDADKLAMLSLLGRVGGADSRALIDAAIAANDPAQRQAGVRAMCNWPDASVAGKLEEFARSAEDEKDRLRALRALIRVAAVADGRGEADRLALLKKTLALVTRDEERQLAIERAKTIRSVESLHFAEAYLDDPRFAEQACATIVELAHHKNLREPNKPAFDKALDRVIKLAKDPALRDRAERYKAGRT